MRRIFPLAFTLIAAACAQVPKSVPGVAANDPSAASAPPTVLVSPQPVTPVDPEVLAAAQRDLRSLGYPSGKTGDLADPAFQKAILAFEKDQGLIEDGRVTQALADRLKRLRAELPRPVTVAAGQNGIFVYSDGSARRQPVGILPPPPAGLVSDAPANFLQPMRPGMTGSYRLGHRAKDGSFAPVTNVTCKIEKMAATTSPLGVFDTIPVNCRADGKTPMQWRSFYAVKLGQMVRQESASGNRDLIAIRPVTANWPSAARAGLDWALTHALDTQGSTAPVLWSSTAVAPRFEIRAYAALAPHDAGLPGGDATSSCRRFDLVQTGDAAHPYPGIACRNAKGGWSLPGGGIAIATPANGFEQKSASAL